MLIGRRKCENTCAIANCPCKLSLVHVALESKCVCRVALSQDFDINFLPCK